VANVEVGGFLFLQWFHFVAPLFCFA
jgi:hypothetical protein